MPDFGRSRLGAGQICGLLLSLGCIRGVVSFMITAVRDKVRLCPKYSFDIGLRLKRRVVKFCGTSEVDCPQPGCVGLGYLGFDMVMCFICEHQWDATEGILGEETELPDGEEAGRPISDSRVLDSVLREASPQIVAASVRHGMAAGGGSLRRRSSGQEVPQLPRVHRDWASIGFRVWGPKAESQEMGALRV